MAERGIGFLIALAGSSLVVAWVPSFLQAAVLVSVGAILVAIGEAEQ